jgi:arabinogalactan endo-1,4-beta-galactosidase
MDVYQHTDNRISGKGFRAVHEFTRERIMLNLRRLAGITLLLGVLLSPLEAQAQTSFICGADVSSLLVTEAAGGEFFDADGAPISDLLIFLRDNGVTHVRLRLWHTPTEGINGLEQTLLMAQRIDALGMKLLLNIHYSDTWADPGHQTKPAAWQDLPFAELRAAVHDYTAEVLAAFNAQGTPPDMIQIGNEITVGMLWPDGYVTDDENWLALIALLRAGVSAVRETSPDTRILIHIDRGSQTPVSQWFFDHIIDRVDFDIIGLSYYPWWSGRMDALAANLTFVAERYGKPVMIAEVAYPWTLGWSDDTHNPVGLASQLEPGFPASAEGQADFLDAVADLTQALPEGLGAGFFTWEPAWIVTPQVGSPWENLTQFDFDGRALPSMRVYARCATED